MKLIISIFLISLSGVAYGQMNHLKIDEKLHNIFYENIYILDGIKQDSLLELVYSHVAAMPGVRNVIKTDNSVTGNYVNAGITFKTSEGKLLTTQRGYNNFDGKIVIDVKDSKYRVQVVDMSTASLSYRFTLGELYLQKGKISKSGLKVLPMLDDYFTQQYTLNKKSEW